MAVQELVDGFVGMRGNLMEVAERKVVETVEEEGDGEEGKMEEDGDVVEGSEGEYEEDCIPESPPPISWYPTTPREG